MGRVRSGGAVAGTLFAAAAGVLLLSAGAVLLLADGDGPPLGDAAPFVLAGPGDLSGMSLPEAVEAPVSKPPGRGPQADAASIAERPGAVVGDATPLTSTGGALRLRVVDPRGDPVVGARVHAVPLSQGLEGFDSDEQSDRGARDEAGHDEFADAPSEPLVTDAEGRVVLPAPLILSVGDEGLVLARHDQVGAARPVQLFDLVAGRSPDGEAELSLLPPAQVEVSVRTHDGTPARGCEVSLHSMGFWREHSGLPSRVTTDAAGLVSVPFASDLTLILRARYADQPETEGSGVAMAEAEPGETTRVELTLPGPWRAFGTVVGWNGEPVPGATVTTWRHLPGGDLDAGRIPPGEPWRDHATADDEGRFHVVLPSAGEYQLLASGSGHGPSEVQRVTVSPAATRAEAWLTMPDGASISGRLVDGRGEPLAGVAVEARPADQRNRARQRYGPTVFARMGEATGVTDADGGFVLAPLHPDGVYSVWCRPVEALRDRKLVVPDVPAGTRDLALVADDEALALAVVEAWVTAGGQSVDGITSVLLIDLDGELVDTRQPPAPSPVGQLRYQGLAPGRSYRLRVDGPGRGAVELPWFEARVGVQRFDVALPLPGSLDLSLVDGAGAPLAGAVVTTRPISSFPLRVGRGRVVTDVAGRARVDDLDPGPHELRVSVPGREVSREVEVLPGALESIRITL